MSYEHTVSNISQGVEIVGIGVLLLGGTVAFANSP
jgi:hypothetical protein